MPPTNQDLPNRITWLRQRLALDPRALALWRIAAGALLLVDLAWRAAELGTFYTDDGILPRATLAALDLPVLQNLPSLSLHALHGSAAWQAALCTIAALCALGLLLGWRTRWMCAACWLLLTSLHAHNPLALYRGDAALRLLLFWSIWLPLGQRWSLDARTRPPPAPIPLATLAITAQWAMLYLVSVLHKRGPAWRDDGLAVYYALQLDDFTTRPGAWLGRLLWEHPSWSAPLTTCALALEILAPLLLLIPWRVAQARALAVLLAIALHGAFILTMRLDLFSWIMLAGWLIFLPTAALDRMTGHPAPPTAPPTPARSPASWLIAALLACVTLWNIGDLWPPQPIPALGAPMRALGLAQRWSMFSPDPARDDGWLVIAAHRADGSRIDVQTGLPPTSAPPARRDADNLRWRAYLMQVTRDEGGALREAYRAWWCRRAPPGTQGIELIFEQEYTMDPGQPPARDTYTLGYTPCAQAP
jgi:hypothetical protein